MDARAHINTHARELIDDLKQWLAIPSISADPEHHGDVRRSAEWLAAHVSAIGFPAAEVWETAPDGLPAGFDRVLPLSAQERDLFARLPFHDTDFLTDPVQTSASSASER